MFKLKKFIKIIKFKKLNGNVSLLIVLVLLASSVIALLSINQIKHLITYGNMTFNYFRSYYLAKAGTELWLTEVYNRDSWFEDTIQSGHAIVTGNLVWNYTGFNPYFTMKIESNFKSITDDIRFGCESGNKIKLLSWEWIVIPLFKDITSWRNIILNPMGGILQWLRKTDIDNINLSDISPNGSELIFWFFVFDDNQNMLEIEVQTWKFLNGFLSGIWNYDDYDQKYLTIKNPWNSSVEFCVEWRGNQKLPYSDALITVQANYADMEVWLQSIVKRQTPSWSMNVLWGVDLSSL